MQIDSNVYPTRRTFTWTDSDGVQQHISISDSIKTLRDNGVLPYNQVWDNSNAYVGFDTSVKQYARIFGGTTSAWYDVTETDKEGYNIVTDQSYSIINIRPVLIAMRRRNADNTGSTITNRVTVTERYTGIDDPDAAAEQMIFATGGDENWFPVTSWNPNSILFHATAQVYKRKRSDYARLGELPVTGLDWLDNLDWIINGYTDTDFISQFVISPYLDTGSNGVISRTAMRSVQSFNTYTGANDFYNFTMSFVAEFYNPVTGAVYYKRLPAGGTGNNPDAPTDEYAPFVYANPNSNPNDIRWNTWGAPVASFGGLWLNENISQPLADGSVTARKIPLSIMADGIPTDDLTTWDASARTNPIISVGLSDNMQIKIREIPNATNEIITAPYQNAPCSIGNGMAIWTCSNPYSTDQLFLIREIYSVAEIEQALSALGIWWTGNPDSINSAIGANCTDPDVHLGVIRSDGTTTGDYISGSAAAASPQAQWTDAMQDNRYNPVDPIPEEQAAENTGVSVFRPDSISVGGTGGFITQYALTAANVAGLGAGLWASLSDPQDLINVIIATALETASFDVSAILDYFLSLKVYPFPLINLPSYQQMQNSLVFFGRGLGYIDVGSGNVGKINQYAGYIDAGKATVPKFYRNFLDYDNTDIIIHLPYVGDFKLQPGDVIGSTLHCQYAVDLAAGSCTAYVDCMTADGIQWPILIASGQIGADIPMSATNAGQIAARVATYGEQQTGYALGVAGMAAAGNAGGAAISGAQAAGRIPIIGQPTTATAKGRATGFASFGDTQTAYIQIRRAITKQPETYAHTDGYSTATGKQIADLSGWTVLDNPDIIGVPATAAEKNEIRQLLQSGFYA